MALDDPFNANNVPTDGEAENNFYNFNEEDHAAEFLEREKRELGDIIGDEPSNSGLNSNSTMTNGTHSPNPSSNASQYQALSQLDEQRNEPEKIRKWRDEFSSRITKKDTDEEVKRKDMREQAKKELDDFYKQRVEQMERRKEENRITNRTLEDELLSNGNSSASSNGKVHDWDKITSLCEFNPKGNRAQKDLTRYRGVLLQLKQQQQQTSGK